MAVVTQGGSARWLAEGLSLQGKEREGKAEDKVGVGLPEMKLSDLLRKWTRWSQATELVDQLNRAGNTLKKNNWGRSDQASP